MKVEIIAVGDEVVYGHTVNTNASYLARNVQLCGLEPSYMSAVGDEAIKIKEALHLALQRSEIIIFTGGLGPTPDDLTKEVVCEALGMKMETLPKVYDALKAYFHKMGKEMPISNEKQAKFPINAKILPNDCGTASGCLLEAQGKMIILLPGPPKEMQPMFSNYVLPLLKNRSSIAIKHLDIKCFGIGESELAEKIKPLLGEQDGANIATYINGGEVIVRITVHEKNDKKADEKLCDLKNKIEQRLEPYIFGYNEDKLEENLMKCLSQRHMTVATVESCTGGLIAATLINYSGASACMNEGIVTYSNEAKMKYVDVQKETLQRVGAVSEETAREMAEGIRKRAQADIGLSSTGIAGPTGGTPSKPVGLVYIGIATREATEVFKLQLNGSRQEVRQKTVKHILFQLYKKLK